MKKYICLVFLFIMAFLCVGDDSKVDLINFRNDVIQVQIQGAVKEEKVVELPAYSTVEDLLKEVDLLENADLSSLNQTMILKDHDVIVIPEQQDKKISINSADLQQLCQIPYVGEKTAQAIIDYRENNGPFQQLEDIKKVKGIGDKKFEKMKDYICL